MSGAPLPQLLDTKAIHEALRKCGIGIDRRKAIPLRRKARLDLDALEAELAEARRERDEARESLTLLRDVWNGHMDTCDSQHSFRHRRWQPTREDIDSWMNAPSDTASGSEGETA